MANHGGAETGASLGGAGGVWGGNGGTRDGRSVSDTPNTFTGGIGNIVLCTSESLALLVFLFKEPKVGKMWHPACSPGGCEC